MRPAPPRWFGPPAVFAIALAGAATVPFAVLVDLVNASPPPFGLEAFAYSAFIFGFTALTLLLLLEVFLASPRASVVWRCLLTGVAMGVLEAWLFAVMWLAFHPTTIRGKMLSLPGVFIAAGIVGLVAGGVFGLLIAPFAYVARDTSRVDTFDRTLYVLSVALLVTALPLAIFQAYGGVDRGYEGFVFSGAAMIGLLVVLVRELGRRAWLGKLQPPWAIVPARAEDRLPIFVAPGPHTLTLVAMEAAGGPFRGAETATRVAQLDPVKARAIATWRAAVAGVLAGVAALSMPLQVHERSWAKEHRRREWAPPHPTAVAGIGLLATTDVYVGEDYGCARLRDMTLRCWGNDGGLISGTAEETNWTATPVFPLGPVREVATPDHDLCVVREGAARPQCFGRDLGRLERDDTGPPTWTGQLASSWHHVYATTVDGPIWMWGVAPEQPFDSNSNVRPPIRPHEIAGTQGLSVVSAGLNHQCGIGEKGAISCWGQNYAGAVNPEVFETSGNVLPPTRVKGIEGANRVIAIDNVTFAHASGRWWIWGDRRSWRFVFDQSYEYDAIPMAGPTPIAGTENVTELVVTGAYACALHDDGAVKCYTAPPSDESPLPQHVMDGLPPGTALSIAGSRQQLCARTTSMLSQIRCWGPREP